jgi:hypothetical protein
MVRPDTVELAVLWAVGVMDDDPDVLAIDGMERVVNGLGYARR